MTPRPDLLDKRSPKGLEVFQLSTEPGAPYCHIYMEAQIFTPDSQRFLLHRATNPHENDKLDPRHQYFFCDVASGERSPATGETGVTART